MMRVEELAEKLGVSISVPRQCKRQTHRSNVGGSSTEEYFRRAVFVPYLDSIILSLDTRFSEKNKINFSLFSLHDIFVITLFLARAFLRIILQPIMLTF